VWQDNLEILVELGKLALTENLVDPVSPVYRVLMELGVQEENQAHKV